jgi:ubiquinone/menaquinone biosynthesis C-methylase UbiE
MTTLELKGIGHELKFWKGFVQTNRFLSDWVGKIVTPELAIDQAEVVVAIQRKLTKNTKVLDLGSGVVSILNGLVPANQLTAADPLGELYECIFDYNQYKLSPPVPFPAEELPQEWTGTFDIVHMRNALDHSQNPMKVLENIFRVKKTGGIVIIHGFCNEAIQEKWQGFHQWNISLDENGDLIIVDANNKKETILNKTFSHTKKISIGREWFIWMA